MKDMVKEISSLLVDFKKEEKMLETEEQTQNCEELSKSPYLKAAMKGREQIVFDATMIKKLSSGFGQTKKILEEFKTIHLKGIRSSPYRLIWALFGELGIDKRKIKFLQFVARDILEVDLVGSYIEDFVEKVENAHKKVGMETLFIKRIQFEALSQENIKNPKNIRDPKEIFEARIEKKIEIIEKLSEKAPYLKRVANYVKLQRQVRSFEVSMKKNENPQYDSYYDFVTAGIDKQNKTTEKREETKVSGNVQEIAKNEPSTRVKRKIRIVPNDSYYDGNLKETCCSAVSLAP